MENPSLLSAFSIDRQDRDARMTTSSSTPSQQTPPDTETHKLATQLSVGPSFREAARELLRQSLLEKYPDLDIDPAMTLMGTPTWELIDDQIVPGPTRYETLSSILARQAILKVPTLCVEGNHFLTLKPLTTPPLHLPVRIVEIANLINTLAPVVYRAFQEQLVTFWNQSNGNGPRWQTLTQSLRGAWNVQHVDAWTDEDCTMARTLFHAPTRSARQGNNPYGSRAYLIDADLVKGSKTQHTDQVFMTVLEGKSEDKTLILCYSPFKGYEKYDTYQQLGDSLKDHLEQPEAFDRLEWRLYEPDGDFFEHAACKLIALQLETVENLKTGDYKQPSAKHPPLQTLPMPAEKAIAKGPGPGWYQTQLPDWLTDASASDQSLYSRHLKDLASLNSLNAGKTYDDGIPSIHQFALDQLKIELLKDHPTLHYLKLDKLKIQVKSLVVWGLFTVPGQFETTTFSLAELALQNLIALPTGNKTLLSDIRQSIPDRITVAYLETLISRCNIGVTYPALIRSKLLDDPAEASRRKKLYRDHLRVQLPMLALQHKIRRMGGIDERGYRYVVAVMQPESGDHYVDGKAIMVRRLSFNPKRRLINGNDDVTNMYIIGPENAQDGPCLLYRPLFEPALLQYPSPANLLYAISQSRTLRDSVISWLPDAVRNHYANYVFTSHWPSPWVIADFLVNPIELWTYSGPVSLGEESLNGDMFKTLFESNAKALIELADRQSVSNAESRWDTLKQAGWVLFNAALPFMGRVASTSAWIWQIVEQLETFAQAHEEGDKPAQWSALTDVLLNLGMAITLHSAQRSRPKFEPARIEPTKVKTTELAPETPGPSSTISFTVEQLPERTSLAPPPDHEIALNTSGAINRTPALETSMLESFKTEKPADLGAVIDQPAADRYLYQSGEQHYAPVGENWFMVKVDDDKNIVVIDPNQANRIGPILIHNAQGEWSVDHRVRLRKPSTDRLKNTAKDLAITEADASRSKLKAFESAKKTQQRLLQETRKAMDEAPSTSAQAKRQAYLDTLDGQSEDYEQARQHLMTIAVFTSEPEFQVKAIGYLQAQLALNEAGVNEELVPFTSKLSPVLEQLPIHAPPPHTSDIADYQQIVEMSDSMIKRLDYAQSRFTELRKFGPAGFDVIRESKRKLPRYMSDDLRALQVTLARHLCLTPESLATEPHAWEMLNDTLDSADVAVQTLRDTLDERSEYRLDERIDALSNLVEQFKFIDERLKDFSQEFSEQIQAQPLERLSRSLQGFANRAKAALVPLHEEQKLTRIRPTPPPALPRPLKKFIQTRYNGVLIGEPRLDPIGTVSRFVDIKTPITGQVLATFHEKTPGMWVEHIETPTAQATSTTLTLHDATTAGEKLLAQLPKFQERASQQANDTSRTAIGIEYMFHQHAWLLERSEQDIDEALIKAKVTAQTKQSSADLRKRLKAATKALYARATETVAKLIKQQPPTIAHVDWLINHREIAIKKVTTRQPLKGATWSYQDEYAVIDLSTSKPLWYAHFQYSSAHASLNRFLHARLKTPAEQQLKEVADTITDLNAEEQLNYYRSSINLTQAQRLFFPPEVY